MYCIIAHDICSNLKKSVPLLGELFNIHRKVGEGAFSSVFLATLKSSNRKKKFALKHLIPTCHPDRIERELKCLQQIGYVKQHWYENIFLVCINIY